MNDVPSDLIPPRIFTTITAARVQYDLDAVRDLTRAEMARRAGEGKPMLDSEVQAFQREMVSKLTVQQDALGAIKHRSHPTE